MELKLLCFDPGSDIGMLLIAPLMELKLYMEKMENIHSFF